ncbi:MAG: acyltransferase family protein [Clostridia bacterium]|nr:acyltransferase family protein [Clostridia bacterium]
METKRNLSIDLLRILCMILVIVRHSLNHGGLIKESLIPGTPNYFICNILFAFCLVAVNCFVLITGYFQCTSTFKLKKLISTWSAAIIYSVTIYITLVMTGTIGFSV